MTDDNNLDDLRSEGISEELLDVLKIDPEKKMTPEEEMEFIQFMNEHSLAFLDDYLNDNLSRLKHLMRTPKNEGTVQYKELQDLRWWCFQKRSSLPLAFETVCRQLGYDPVEILDSIELMYPGINPHGEWLRKAQEQFDARLARAKSIEEQNKLMLAFQSELDHFYDEINNQMSLLDDLQSELREPDQSIKRTRGPYKKRCPEEAKLFQQADLF